MYWQVWQQAILQELLHCVHLSGLGALYSSLGALYSSLVHNSVPFIALQTKYVFLDIHH